MSDGPSLNDPDPWAEWGWTCGVCGHNESWTSEMSSRLSAALHVRDAHPDYLGAAPDDLTVLGTLTPPPERYGRKLDDWESQL